MSMSQGQTPRQGVGPALASHLDGKRIQVVQHDVVGLREQGGVALQRGTV